MRELEGWVARDEDGRLFLFLIEPQKAIGQWIGSRYIRLGSAFFPEIQWSDDEPTRVSITIKK